ncbi:MAG: hypothetical protein ACREJO_00150 [Phycisphaerales bacterium]
MLNDLCSAKLTTTTEAIKWLRRATHEIGPGFHPDTPASDYVAAASGMPLFGAQDAEAFDANIGRAFELLGEEVYEYGGHIQRALLQGRIR